MKKLLLILLFSLVAVSVNAQVYYPPQLDSLRQYVALSLFIDESGTNDITADVMNNAINRSITQVCRDFPAFPKFDTVYIKSDIEGTDLNDDFLRTKALFVLEDALIPNKKIKLPSQATSPDSLSFEKETKDGNTHKPNRELSTDSYHTFGKKLFYHPQWLDDDSMQVQVYYYATDNWLESGSDSTNILVDFREPIIYYSLSLIWGNRGRFDRANYYYSLYQQRISPRSELNEGKR